MFKQLFVFLTIVVVLAASVITTERTFSPTFKECIAKTYEQNKSNSAKEYEPAFGLRVFTYVFCTGQFLDATGVAITALATIVIAAFTGTLWYATSQQSELTRQAFIADKRAFVFAKGFRALYEPGGPNNTWQWRFSPVWSNSGDTPTQGLQFYCDGFLSNARLQPTFDLTYEDPAYPRGPGMLGPRSEGSAGMAPRSTQMAITAQDIHDIQAGNKFFYMYGSARYSDSMPDTPQRITRFCWQMVVTGNPFTFDPTIDPQGVSWTNVHQGRGNCADNECAIQGLE